MSDKKIIIFAIILSLLMIGGAWYYAQQPGGLSPATSSPSVSDSVGEVGILIGDPNAPVTMEEYTNFLCPACARFAATTLGQIKDDYIKTGKVKIIMYVLPPYELGWAALCAEEQNEFGEYHDYLFEHQTQITKENDLKDMAVNAGLDSAKFNACYDSGRYTEKVAKWYGEANSRGVESTPTFFINGQKLIGAQPYTDFKKIIDEKLNQAR